MSKYDKSEKNIILSFAIVSILFILLGAISIQKMMELSSITQKLYEHPLSVTNATKDVQMHLVSMHKYMQDTVLASDEEERKLALRLVDKNEKIIYKNFDIVFDRYLGDKKDIQASYDLFVEWKDIRTEIIDLIYLGKINEAIQVIKEKDSKHTLKLSKSVDVLVNYAYKKGKNFALHSDETKDFSISLTVTVIIMVLLLILSIVVVLLKSLSNIVLTRKKQTQQLISQSRLAQMGEMISMIAHQWRQPLGAISATSIDMRMQIELETFDLSKEEDRELCLAYFSNSLKNIDEFVKNLTTTIDDFRNFYKPNKNVDLLPVSLPISTAIKIIEASFISNNIKIIQTYEDENINIKIEMFANELVQVFLNIFKNAQDNFNEQSIRNPIIQIISKKINNGISIEILDNGGGIPIEILDDIFDPYFSTKDEKNGSGLGLYMSKIIIQEHHAGTLSVNNLKDGVSFTIELKDKIHE